MSKKPWMKFYTTDWKADPCLRMCSYAARGLWIELLCIMHDAEPYGHLVVNSRPLNDTQIAALTGGDASTVSELLSELESNAVFSRNRDGVIYSRRMVDDDRKARIAEKNGKNGGSPTLCNIRRIRPSVNPPLKPPDKGGVNTQKPEARVQKKEREDANASSPKKGWPPDPDFERFWEGWIPFDMDRGSKQNARKAYENARKEVSHEELIAKRDQYLGQCHAAGRRTTHASTWLNPAGRRGYADSYDGADDLSHVPPFARKPGGFADDALRARVNATARQVDLLIGDARV